MPSPRFFPALAVLVFLLLDTGAPRSASAADTTECFAVGPTDFEFYLSMAGLGLPASDQRLGSQIVLGYGLTQRLSGYLGTVLSADGNMVRGSSEIAAGIFGTPLDTDHLDLDVFLEFSNDELDEFTTGPSLELNWDARPDQTTWGLYARSGLAISGSITLAGSRRTSDLELTMGAYWTVAPGHQLLVEFDGARKDNAGGHSPLHDSEKEWTTGGWAVGYNAAINKTMELISQAYLDVPGDEESYSWGLMLGFIATMSPGL